MTSASLFLARRRWAAVGLAILAESLVLLPLAYADPSTIVGIPAAVAAAIGGTVAVVFGPLDGAIVAFVGAVVFGWAGGWEAGELVALGVWPAIVVGAGVVAGRIGRQRHALAQLLEAQESERERIALELHDERAQALAAALLTLRRAEGAATDDEAGAANQAARELIQETIRSLRGLAVELRPKVLDDFGLAPAVEAMAASFGERRGIDVEVDVGTGGERLPPELELTVYRAVQEMLGSVAASADGGRARITIERRPTDVRVLTEYEGGGAPATGNGELPELVGLRERVRLAGGRLIAKRSGTAAIVRVELPLRPVVGGSPRHD